MEKKIEMLESSLITLQKSLKRQKLVSLATTMLLLCVLLIAAQEKPITFTEPISHLVTNHLSVVEWGSNEEVASLTSMGSEGVVFEMKEGRLLKPRIRMRVNRGGGEIYLGDKVYIASTEDGYPEITLSNPKQDTYLTMGLDIMGNVLLRMGGKGGNPGIVLTAPKDGDSGFRIDGKPIEFRSGD